MKEPPVFIKTIEIYETYVKKDGLVYLKWKFINDKRWHYRKTAYNDIPYVMLKMPKPLILPEGMYIKEAPTN